MGRFESKIAIVTGAGSGIGRAILLRLAREGARVLAVDITGHDTAAREAGEQVESVRCDVSSSADVEAVHAHCLRRFGRLDVLFNNAGIRTSGKRLHEVSMESFDKVLAVNLRGAFLMLKHSIGLMLASGGGSIVNTASIGGFKAVAKNESYSISKAGLIQMTRQAALEYAGDNIRVNAVCPGPVITGFSAGSTPETMAAIEKTMLMGRFGTPEEAAAVALFLGSGEAAYVTGSCYVVDGGRSIA